MTVPVASGCRPLSNTGGLAHAVIDVNDATTAAGVTTSAQFYPATAPVDPIRRTIDLFRQLCRWARMKRNGAISDLGRAKVAEVHADLDRSIATVDGGPI